MMPRACVHAGPCLPLPPPFLKFQQEFRKRYESEEDYYNVSIHKIPENLPEGALSRHGNFIFRKMFLKLFPFSAPIFLVRHSNMNPN